MLDWAARLHEIGLVVSHGSFHKHGAYLLANADMPGFTRQQQAILASLVRVHRRKFTDAEVQKALGVVPYKVSAAANGDVRVHMGDKAYSPPEISALPDVRSMTVPFGPITASPRSSGRSYPPASSAPSAEPWRRARR